MIRYSMNITLKAEGDLTHKINYSRKFERQEAKVYAILSRRHRGYDIIKLDRTYLLTLKNT